MVVVTYVMDTYATPFPRTHTIFLVTEGAGCTSIAHLRYCTYAAGVDPLLSTFSQEHTGMAYAGHKYAQYRSVTSFLPGHRNQTGLSSTPADVDTCDISLRHHNAINHDIIFSSSGRWLSKACIALSLSGQDIFCAPLFIVLKTPLFCLPENE